MKKKIVITTSIIITMLISISTYAYINNKKLSEYVDESTILRQEILILGDLRTYIVKCSQAQKLYILTENENYKDDFNYNIKKAYELIDDMHKQNYITTTEKKKLILTVDDYKNTSINLFNQNYSNIITPEVEKHIKDYNNQQLGILTEITLDITSQSEDFIKQNDKINSLYSMQTKLIQGVSSSITILISGFLYYFKKKLNKDNIDIEDIISYLSKYNNEIDEDNKNKSSVPEINTDLNGLKAKIMENEILLSNAKLLYMQSVKLKGQLEKSEILLKEIDTSIKDFTFKLDNIDDYPILAQKIILEDIENQLINLTILFKSLPYYNEFIIDISKNIISKK